MNKFLGLLAVGGLLLAQATASNAVSLTLNTVTGALTPGSDYTTSIDTPAVPSPGTAGTFFDSELAAGTNTTSVGVGSIISYGSTFVAAGAPPPAVDTHYTGTYTNQTADYQFTAQVDSGVAKTFDVHGVLDGSYDLTYASSAGGNVNPFNTANGYGSNSSVHWIFKSLFDVTDATFVTATPGVSPVARQGLEVMYQLQDSGGAKYFIDQWFDNEFNNGFGNPPTGESVPGEFNSALSLGGYIIGTTVPEPNSLAMLFAGGLTGSLLIRRRRRA